MAQSKSVLVIGGHGHIGRFLVPRLANAGWQVTVLTRGKKPAPDAATWKDLSVRHIAADYHQLCSQQSWPAVPAEAAPHAIVDILGHDAKAVVAVSPASVEHVVVCGSLWMFGPPRKIPTPERTQGPCPFEPYHRRYQQLQELLADDNGPAITAVFPSNIAGPGKIPLEPYGGRDIQVHRHMAAGREIILPADGQTLAGPCDAEDIAEVFALALAKPDQAAGQMFNAAAAYAFTYNEMVAVYGRIHGVQIPVRTVTWDEFDQALHADASQRYHHEAHMCADITAARTVLGYEPRHSPDTALARAVEWMHSQHLFEQ